VLKKFGKKIPDQIQLLSGIELLCTADEDKYAHLFIFILQLLYELDVIEEDAIFQWEQHRLKQGSEVAILQRAQPFLKWLHEAEEDE